MVVLLGASVIVPKGTIPQAASKIVCVYLRCICSIGAYTVACIYRHRCNPSERVSLTVAISHNGENSWTHHRLDVIFKAVAI